MSYEVWDRTSGNRLGQFETLPAATAWLLELWDQGGTEAVEDLEVGDDQLEVPALRGPDLVRTARARAAS